MLYRYTITLRNGIVQYHNATRHVVDQDVMTRRTSFVLYNENEPTGQYDHSEILGWYREVIKHEG